MGNLNFLAKLLNTSYFICLTLLFGILGFLLVDSYSNYFNTFDSSFYYNLFFIVVILIYITLLSKIKSKIEHGIYKENYEQILIPLVIQAVLYGIITPFSLVNYYVIYKLVSSNEMNFLKRLEKKQKYYLSLVLLYIGLVSFMVHLFVKYLNLLTGIYEMLKSSNIHFTFSFFFSFLILIVWLILIRIAIKLINENKYIESAVCSIIVGILANPFSFHGICLITAGIIILVQDQNFEQLKKKMIELKDQLIHK